MLPKFCSSILNYQKSCCQLTDTNECDSNPCGTNADCFNTLGSFICQCSPGYSGDPLVDCSESLFVLYLR